MGQKTLVKSSAQHIERGFKAAKLQHFKWQECSLFVLACLLLWCCPRVCCENVDRRLHKKHQVEERDHAVTCNDNFIYKNILIWRRVDLIAGGGVLITKYDTTLHFHVFPLHTRGYLHDMTHNMCRYLQWYIYMTNNNMCGCHQNQRGRYFKCFPLTVVGCKLRCKVRLRLIGHKDGLHRSKWE